MLNKERIGEIALAVLQHTLEKHGDLILQPEEVKRQVVNSSKKFGITPQEGAEFFSIVLSEAYEKTIAELKAIVAKPGKVLTIVQTDS